MTNIKFVFNTTNRILNLFNFDIMRQYVTKDGQINSITLQSSTSMSKEELALLRDSINEFLQDKKVD
jgi:hypothetical protein